MLYFAALGAIALAVVRVAVLTTLRTLRQRGFNVRRVLVVGSGDAARTVVQTVSGLPELGLRVVGLLTQDGSSQGELTGVAVLGAFGDLKRVVEAEKPHQVLIALAPDQQAELTPMLACLTDATVAVHVVPDFRAFAALHCYAETFEGIPIIRLNESRMDALQAVAKRCLDIVVTAFALVVAAPLFVLLSALITLTSPGPVFYAQERMGLDGRTFRMFKFRSMHVDAEANSGAVWSRKVDDRRTPIGAFLRKTSLDELPQLWNVLRGDMSLVGPRPERPVFVEEFRRRIPAYMLRHKVKAGITGWAQVNGWRGDTSLVERTACDLYYIRNWSLTLDFKILAMTFLKGFVNKNAY
jgi:Undecaprenyl-phosphate glucose phosphotransferase